MDRILPNRRSKTLFTWACVVLAGSIFHYFYPESTETALITWGVLILAGIGITSYLTDWSDTAGRVIQILRILVAAGLIILYAGSAYGLIQPNFLNADIYLTWSVVWSVGYILTALISRDRQLFVAGLVSLFLVPLFGVPALAPYTTLLFGIAHGAILLILAF